MGLFEDLAQKANCLISDLRRTVKLDWDVSVFDELAQNTYPIEEWQDIAHYLTGERCAFASAAEAVTFLKAALA